jgi:Peptidase family M3
LNVPRAASCVAFCALLLPCFTAIAGDQQVLRTEQVFADFLDAHSAVETIDSGLLTEVDGRDGTTWRKRRGDAVAQLSTSLKTLQAAKVTPADTRVVKHMSATFDELSDPGASMAPASKCEDATKPQTDADVLQTSIYACFDEVGNRLPFEGERITRSGALQRLQEIEEPARRKALFFAMAPLWEAVNGKNESTSPYRRMIPMAANAFKSKPSPLSEAAQALATDVPTLDRWLVELLEAWRVANRESAPIEPWDYRHDLARASRTLNKSMALDVAAELNQRFFADLGADPRKLGVLFDIRPRPGKAPIAYSDTVRIGRELNGQWRPAVSRISANYEHGGLYILNELTHETGHAVHYIAVRARPAYFWADTLFIEAFADVPSWSVFEPAWQQKYLGRSVSRSDGLRERYSLVMLDVAWGLFEIRMLRDPATDPNALWTDITSRYLGIVPHPELSWWAVRGQLGSNPGYMINYAIGAIITADVRQRTSAVIGPFDAGNPKWYAWLSENLLKFGGEFDTSELLERFLGKPLTADALIQEIESIQPTRSTASAAR